MDQTKGVIVAVLILNVPTAKLPRVARLLRRGLAAEWEDSCLEWDTELAEQLEVWCNLYAPRPGIDPFWKVQESE